MNDNDFSNNGANDNFEFIDYSNDDLKQIKTINMNGFTVNGSNNIN